MRISTLSVSTEATPPCGIAERTSTSELKDAAPARGQICAAPFRSVTYRSTHNVVRMAFGLAE